MQDLQASIFFPETQYQADVPPDLMAGGGWESQLLLRYCPLLLLREKAEVKSPLQACGGRAQKGLNHVGLGGGHQPGWDAWVPVLPLS